MSLNGHISQVHKGPPMSNLLTDRQQSVYDMIRELIVKRIELLTQVPGIEA